MWFIHIMEYYSTLKKEKILQHAKVLINPKGIMLSETS